jgi:hypothetical protein
MMVAVDEVAAEGMTLAVLLALPFVVPVLVLLGLAILLPKQPARRRRPIAFVAMAVLLVNVAVVALVGRNGT